MLARVYKDKTIKKGGLFEQIVKRRHNLNIFFANNS